ncbi:MAG: HlyD family efflux transporter periplasmic adaptor subunit [Cyanobacteria bacterium K_DeepCast_35m_m2_023]|nr:HlyD family efflux transporter periplasmic adaptor subunit [Cyanobacteria bacterium K_DeepCast_35m_m2_023]
MTNKPKTTPLLKRLDPRLWLQHSQDLLERSVRSDHEEVVLQQSGSWTRAITWALMGGTAFGLIWLATAKTEEIVVATGKLEPVSRVIDVQMPIQGIAKAILVKEGQRVNKGQVLIQLDTEATKDRYKSTLENVSLKQAELNFKNQELQNTLALSNTRITSLQQSLVLANKVLARLESLSKQGAAAELQYLEQRDKVQQLEGEIRQITADRKRQVSVLEQNICSLKGALSELGSQRTEGNVTLRYQAIVAPVNGIVFDLKPKTPGFVAQSSEPILKIVPIDKLQARVEIDSRSIGFVSVGAPADISIDSYPASDFGVINGRVKRISSDALPPDPALNKDYRFPADITLASQVLKLKDGKRLPLQVGMSLTANIKLRKVTYLQLLLSSFRDKADSLRRL